MGRREGERFEIVQQVATVISSIAADGSGRGVVVGASTVFTKEEREVAGDERGVGDDITLERDQETTEQNHDKAGELELEYRREIARIRRAADEDVRKAKLSSQQQHTEFLRDERRSAERNLMQIRKEAEAHVDAQRETLLQDVPELVDLIHDRLGIPAENGNGGS